MVESFVRSAALARQKAYSGELIKTCLSYLYIYKTCLSYSYVYLFIYILFLGYLSSYLYLIPIGISLSVRCDAESCPALILNFNLIFYFYFKKSNEKVETSERLSSKE